MKPALILIDVQQGFNDPKWGKRNNPDAEQRMAELLAAWRAAQAPVIHFQHHSTEAGSPLRPGQQGCEIKPEVAPVGGEPVRSKNVNSCFIGTGLGEELERKHINTLVLAGLTTDHCVSTTARMGANLGYRIYVVSDATATFEREGPEGKRFDAQAMHETALASLNGEFAQVMPAAEIVRKVLGGAIE